MKKQESKALFSINAITIATFIGGWIAGLLMLSYNFKHLGKKEEARKINIVNLVVTVLFFIALALIPSEWIEKLPSVALPIAYVLLIKIYAEKTQKLELEKYFAEGGKKGSVIKTIPYVLFSIAVIILPLLIYILFPTSNMLTIDCSKYKLNEANRDKKIFVHEEAVCFMFKNLQDNSITLDEVNEVVYLESEALQKAGLLGDYNKEGLAQTNSTQYFDPLPYIMKNKKSNLTENEVIRILEEENKYLEFIGAIKQ